MAASVKPRAAATAKASGAARARNATKASPSAAKGSRAVAKPERKSPGKTQGTPTKSAGSTGIPIMVVEDSPVHGKLLLNALKNTGKTPVVDLQEDAEGAWAQIERMRRKPRPEWPVMAIVDLGLPGMGGIELVDRIRHERELNDWPVLVLTASEDPDDIKESMMARASGYIVKPHTGSGYTELANDIVEFWIPRAMGEGANRIPSVKRSPPKDTHEQPHEGPPPGM